MLLKKPHFFRGKPNTRWVKTWYKRELAVGLFPDAQVTFVEIKGRLCLRCTLSKPQNQTETTAKNRLKTVLHPGTPSIQTTFSILEAKALFLAPPLRFRSGAEDVAGRGDAAIFPQLPQGQTSSFAINIIDWERILFA